jgi:hypothetical protein
MIMPKFPKTLYYLTGCDVDKLTYLAPVAETDYLAAYINKFTLEVRVVNISYIKQDPYYIDELAAIEQASAYIQRRLDIYKSIIDELKK